MEADRYHPCWEARERKLKGKEFLLDANGTLNLSRVGYAKTPILDYNPQNIRIYPIKFLNRLRLKEWDYYGVTTKDFFFSATISNIGYLGLVFAYFIDFAQKSMIEDTVVTPFGAGCVLPRSSESGDILFRKGKVDISFLRREERRIIQVNWKQFNKGVDLSAKIVAYQPADMDTIVVVTPIGKGPFYFKKFYYNQKINCMPTEGNITLGNARYELKRSDSLANLDWGRGVWAYKTFWNWASASGFLKDKRTIGLNLGCGFGNQAFATENCFFVNGKMTKIGPVTFNYDPSDYKKPWRFVSTEGRLNLEFTPFFERAAKINLGLLKSEVHQMFGKYSGHLITSDEEKIEVCELIGWAEEHRARW